MDDPNEWAKGNHVLDAEESVTVRWDQVETTRVTQVTYD